MFDKALSLFKSFAEEIDPQVLQRKFLLALLELQNVSRGSIWIKKETRYLCIDAVGLESDGLRGVEIESDRPSIVGWVIENGKITTADPKKDPRHYKELEENLAVKSRRILCLPLFLRDKTVYGAVQIIDTRPEENPSSIDPDRLSQIQDLVNIGSIALSNAIFYNDQLKETRTLKQTLNQIRSEGVILGQSPVLLKVLGLVRNYARTDYPVLITGESGTGKELVAHRIHQEGRRKDRAFVVQNCSAIPETLLESELFGHKKGSFSGAFDDKVGLFEAADGGTVFLDEIGDMPINLQARILRVVQNSEIKPVGQNRPKRIDIRIISATNKNIHQAVADNTFRHDLFYRLAVLPLHMPPLRERREDIALLFNHFMKREALRLGLPAKKVDGEAMQRLTCYPWAGNIRELENLVRYLLVVTDDPIITAEALPFFFHGDPPLPMIPGTVSPTVDGNAQAADAVDPPLTFANMTWEAVERTYVTYLLEKTAGNITRAARDAGVNRSTFASRLRRLGIEVSR
ncbi:MAG: sigma-54-dependent Fis family transcriptional regulator [Desulfobacterales bacterium]|nr:sigma-54-dependent Fis family transcriptional regulator [Desulfobacterales bacterium]